MPDPFLDALDQVRGGGPSPSSVPHTRDYHDQRAAALKAEDADPFLSALSDVRAGAPEPDRRSRVARVIDRLSEPLLPQIGQAGRALEQRLSTPLMAEQRINDSVPGLGTAIAASRGMGAGIGRGVADVIGTLSSPVGAAATLAGFGGEGAAARGLINTARALRATEAAAGGAFAARGLEQAAGGEGVGEKALGVAQAASGLLGVRGGVGGFLRTGDVPTAVVAAGPRGFLRSAPGYVAGETGPAARYGEAIPMAQAPDGSFVRSVPAEYAQREIRGYLPSGPRFEAGESGPAAIYGATPAAPARPPVADPSYVRSVPGQWATREPRGFLRAATGYLAPESGAAIPIEQAGPIIPALGPRSSIEAPPIQPGESGGRLVSAAPLAYGFENARGATGRASQRMVPTQFSGDPNAVPAPPVELTPQIAHALNWIREDYGAHGFTPRTFQEAGPGRGGDLEVTGGAGGSAIHGYIVGNRNIGRAAVLKAIDNLEGGKLTPLGADVLSAAQDLAAGKREAVRLMTLPPEAGGDLAGTAFASRQAEASSSSGVPGSLSVRDYAGALAAEGDKPIAEVPYALSRGVSRMQEPQAADLLSGTGNYGAGGARPVSGQRLKLETETQGADELDRLLNDIHGEDRPTVGNGTYHEYDAFSQAVDEVIGQRRGGTPGGREPGEEGAINPMLAARLGLGGAGAVYGAATGTDTEDRLKRAALFGAAGAIAPSLFEGAGGFLRTGRPAQTNEGPPRVLQTNAPQPPIASAREPLPMLDRQIESFPAELQSGIRRILEENGGFQQARGGGRQPMTETAARALGVDVNLRRPIDSGPQLAEQIGAWKNALATLEQRSQALGARVQSGHATELEQAEFLRVNADRVAAAAGMSGRVTEAGRALNYSRALAQAIESSDIRFVREVLRQGGDATQLATQLGQLQGDPIAQLNYLQRQQQLSGSELVRGVFYQNILSGVKSSLRNVIGNSLNAATDFLIRPMFTVPLDVAESAITGRQRQVFLGELGPRVEGAIVGIPKALRDALFEMQYGFSREQTMAGAWDQLHPELPGGIATNLFTRNLQAQDRLQFEVLRQSEEFGHAFAIAKREGLSGAALQTRVAELKLNLPDEARRAAASEAERLLFREDAGPFVDAVSRVKRSFPVLDFIIPFLKISSNQIRQALERSPAGAFMSAARQPGRAGIEARGRVLGGTAALGALTYYIGLGQVSGNGPSDPAQRNVLMQSGWRPNSIRMHLPAALASSLGASPARDGAYWVSYSGLPFAPTVAALANGWESWNQSSKKPQELDSVVSRTIFQSMASIVSQSFWSGVLNLSEALQDPERNAAKFFQQYAQSFIPASGLMRNVTQAIDPVVRNPGNLQEAAQSIIPGLSSQVPPRIDAMGQPMTRPGNAFQRGFAVAPLALSPESADPVVGELQRLGVGLGPLSPALEVGHQQVPLNRQDRQGLQEVRGQVRYDVLQRIVSSPAYQGLSDDQRRAVIEAAKTQAGTLSGAYARGQQQRGAPIRSEDMRRALLNSMQERR